MASELYQYYLLSFFVLFFALHSPALLFCYAWPGNRMLDFRNIGCRKATARKAGEDTDTTQSTGCGEYSTRTICEAKAGSYYIYQGTELMLNDIIAHHVPGQPDPGDFQTVA
jgi:hypothetical protein